MKLSILTLISFSLFYTADLHAQKVILKQVWETDTALKTPESVILEPRENVLYISCINGNPNKENKNSFIAKIDQNGKILKLNFTEGLNSTKGMGISGRNLYVTEMTNIVEIALSSGKILNRYPVEGAKFLNDISVDSKSGVIYISDSSTGKIWSLKNGNIALVIEGDPLKGINGLLVEKRELLIGNGDGTLLSMNISSKKLTTIAKISGGIDGIVALGNKKYIVSEWSGKVWHIHADGTSEIMIDSSKEKINSADIDYNPKTKMLFIPTFFDNKVKAYVLN